MKANPFKPVELMKHSDMPHALIGPSMYLVTTRENLKRIYVTGVDADQKETQRLMYFADDKWHLINDLCIASVAFSALIVLTSSTSDEIKLCLFGGLELDPVSNSHTKKSSSICIVGELDVETAELEDYDGEAIPDYFYDNQVLEVMEWQKPQERQFILLGKEMTWQVTFKNGEYY
jgi:hypothetical protein